MNIADSHIPFFIYDKISTDLTGLNFPPCALSHQELLSYLKQQKYFLLLVADKQKAKDLLQKTPYVAESSCLRLIVMDDDFTEAETIYFLNVPTVQKIIPKNRGLSFINEHIEQSLNTVQEMFESDNIINKVRSQNKMLNEVNENLENIVHQRTENLETSRSIVESTLRSVKDLIKFIKNLSLINNFDDFIILLKQEFIKFHKTRSPLLVYSLGDSELRCIFFQGPQIIDQALHVDPQNLFTVDVAKVRESLANALERPVGPITTLLFELQDNRGILIFEHSFSDDELKLFQKVIEERTESLRVAFERLALKWRAHLISRQWSSTFDLLRDPISIIDKNFRVIRSNKEFSQFSGDLCYQLFAGRTEPCVGCPAAASIQSHHRSSGRVNAVEKVFDVDANPIEIEGALESTNWIVYYKDVTRSAHLQGQLVQSEKMAAIGMLAGNIAHELNNPLTGIKSLTQILLSEIPGDSPVHMDLLEVQNASERCEQIIKNLLDFSTGKSNEFSKNSVRDVVQKTLPLLKTALHYFNSHIDLSTEEDFVDIDPQLFQQVIFNLVNNACQAMGHQGELTIHSEVDTGWVRLRIRDTGPGVPPQLRAEIFAPFFTTKVEGQGTGLGLSVSRSIVEKFKGKLYLNDDVIQGSEFVIELPRSLS